MTDFAPLPTLTHYERIGGEEGVRRLVERFYDLMDSLPEAQTIRALHAKSLKSSRDKLFRFLSGWLGGPALYIERYGHPRLRMRHFPFAIASTERDEWMTCMKRALEETVEDAALRNELVEAFLRVADHMRNRPDEPPADS